MRTGGAARRWHAAFELSKKLANQRGLAHPQTGVGAEVAGPAGQGAPGIADQSFVNALLELYEKSKHDDPRMRQYLALCLGYVQGQGVREALIDSLLDPDTQVRFYAVWSLTLKHDTEVIPRLLSMLKDEDPALQKVIIYSLGTLGDSRAVPALKEHLNDAQSDIRWNAALSLARLGNSSGVSTLMQMLDRAFLQNISEMNDRQREQAMINAIRAAVLLNDASLAQKVAGLAKQDSSLKVRQAALEATEMMAKDSKQ